MAASGHTPTREDLIAYECEFRDLLLRIQQRGQGGRATSGRYSKDETARMRYIKTIAQRGLRFGRVPPDDDMRMLRCDPLSTPGLPDATKIALTAWAAKHAKDPRKAVAWDDELQQTSLLRWLESETTNMASPIHALRGKTKAVVIDFGQYRGYTLNEVMRKGRLGQPIDLKPGDKPKEVPPGPWMVWLCKAKVFKFPQDIALYYALRDGAGSVHGNDGIEILELPPRVHSDYESYVESVLSPREGDDEEEEAASADAGGASSSAEVRTHGCSNSTSHTYLLPLTVHLPLTDARDAPAARRQSGARPRRRRPPTTSARESSRATASSSTRRSPR